MRHTKNVTNFSIAITPHLDKMLKIMAKKENRSRNYIINIALKETVERYDFKNTK